MPSSPLAHQWPAVTPMRLPGDFDPKGADLSSLIGASVLDGTTPTAWVASSAPWRMPGRRHRDRRNIADEFTARLVDIMRDIGEGVIRHLWVGYSVQEWCDGTEGGKRTRTAISGRRANPLLRTLRIAMLTQGTGTWTVTRRVSIKRTIRELATRAGATTSIVDEMIDRPFALEEAQVLILDDVTAAARSRSVRERLCHPRRSRTLQDCGHRCLDHAHRAGASACCCCRAIRRPEHCQDRRVALTSMASRPSAWARSVDHRALDSTSDFPTSC